MQSGNKRIDRQTDAADCFAVLADAVGNVTDASGSRAVGRMINDVYDFVCVSVCPRSERKTARAIHAKLSPRTHN